ncbi:hypothetical protein L345_14210 [Ophiophagus hannah]|uniref:Uncharacterized protein n=1 Tax=Ophiophagus hannah TaxID=8665 RepID=V8NEK4_OPHHA|nr:hypothetical protein L345_14210 [Ophiophagus hannah]
MEPRKTVSKKIFPSWFLFPPFLYTYRFVGLRTVESSSPLLLKKKHYFSQQAINIVPLDFYLCKCKVQNLNLLPIPISPNVQPSSLLVALKTINWLKFCDLPLGFVG